MKYRIGITSLGYQCVEHLDRVFDLWRKIKKEGVLSDVIEDVFISTAHGCFHETAKIGYPLFSNDGTIEKFEQLHKEGVIDQLQIFDHPRFEFEFWNSNLPFLFEKKVNLLFMLNMDEVWSEEELRAALLFISQKPHTNYFKVNFKNYVFDFNSYVKTFIVPRFWRADKNGGIKGFHFDDELTFADGKRDVQCPHWVIPFETCAPKHFSWVSNTPGYLKRKCEFQNEHYKECSYQWDNQAEQLIFNADYYAKRNIAPPQVFKD